MIKSSLPYSFKASRVAGLSALPLCAIIAGCGPKAADRDLQQAAARNSLVDDAKKGSQQTIKNATGKGISFRADDGKGNTLLKITARGANYEGGGIIAVSNNATFTGASAQLYRAGKPESTFSAESISMVREGKVIRLKMAGNVRAYTSGPWTGKRGPVALQAPAAEVDINKRQVTAPRGATMTQGTGANRTNVFAREVQVNTKLSLATLRQAVRASNGGSTVTADAATWNWETGRAQVTGKVVAQHDGTTVSGGSLEADSTARRGEVRGGVRAKSDKGEATAQHVRYDWGAGTIAASGGVTLTKDGGTLRAGRIDTDSKLNGARATGGITLQKGEATMKAAQAQAFDQMSRASASGSVTLTRGNITMRADRVQADNLNDDSKAKITAEGGVRLTQPGTVVTAGRAEATGIANKSATRIVASDDVRFTKDGKVVTASRVEATNLGAKGKEHVTASGGVRFNGSDIAVSAARVETANFASETPAHFVASGGVVARGKEGTVRAERVQRDGAQVLATGHVTLTKDGNTLSGSRLESKDDFKNATLTGNVRARTAEGGTITAGLLKWSNAGGIDNAERGRIQARDGVTMSQDGTKLRGDLLDAKADGSEATLTGNVVVIAADGAIVRAPTARYDGKTDKIYASGGVWYQDAQKQVLEGKTLVYDRRQKKADLTELRIMGNVNLYKGKKSFGKH